MCFPNEDITGLLEFCYIYTQLLITKGNQKNVSICKLSYQTVCRITKEFLIAPKSIKHSEKSGRPVTVKTNVSNVKEIQIEKADTQFVILSMLLAHHVGGCFSFDRILIIQNTFAIRIPHILTDDIKTGWSYKITCFTFRSSIIDNCYKYCYW